MSTNKIKVTIINKETNTTYEANAIFIDNTIKYKEPDQTITIFDYQNNTLTRDNKELRMIYSFEIDKETIGTIDVKELKRQLTLNIKTNKIKKQKINLELDFNIDEDNFKYKIEEII